MTVLILAAGKQKRWEGYGVKQLADLDGETVIARIVRQVLRHNEVPIVVTGSAQIRRACLDLCITYEPGACRWITETILSTRPYWTMQQVVLLGDVIYSHDTLERIMHDPRGFQIYGNTGEVFALRFRYSNEPLLRGIHEDAERRQQDGIERGRVWNLYRQLCGRDLDKHFYPFEDDPNFTYVRDYTADIDTVEAYEAFWTGVVQEGKLDDLPEVMHA